MWLTTCSFVFLPVESVVLALLEDDRFYLLADPLWTAMRDEIRYVSLLPVDFFADIAEVVGLGISGGVLKHETMRSLHISCAYYWAESFAEPKRDPWQLTQGDIVTNIGALRDREAAPRDYTARQLRNALRCGKELGEVVRSQMLLRDAPATTGLAEKGHGMGGWRDAWAPNDFHGHSVRTRAFQ